VNKRPIGFHQYLARRGYDFRAASGAFLRQMFLSAWAEPGLRRFWRIWNPLYGYFIRPLWRQPDRIIEDAVAKATYVKTQRVWKVYWQRADLKWHRYDPDPEVDSLDEFLCETARR
jgi:hypothetical protein